jgi:hypothetical protein
MRLKRSGPSKAAEAIVAILLPPACREEVLGDLHERYRSRLQYAADALSTVPLVILSRIRRTADPQVLLMQAFALSLSFLGAARFKDPGLLQAQWGLLRLAVPAGVALLGIVLEDAYAKPGKRSPLSLVRGPAIGLALALASQSTVLPRDILFYGCAMSFLLASAIRLLFRPAADQLQGVNAPALWLKRAGGAAEIPQGILQAVIVAIVVAGAIIVASMAGVPPPKIRVVVTALLFGVAAYHLRKRL